MFGCPLLNGFEITHDRIDTRFHRFRTESLWTASECITPHRHLTNAVRCHAAAVDDLAQALAGKRPPFRAVYFVRSGGVLRSSSAIGPPPRAVVP